LVFPDCCRHTASRVVSSEGCMGPSKFPKLSAKRDVDVSPEKKEDNVTMPVFGRFPRLLPRVWNDISIHVRRFCPEMTLRCKALESRAMLAQRPRRSGSLNGIKRFG